MGDRNRSFQNSNVNQTQKISKSVFVTNFPDTTTAHSLWKTCNAYGTVVDVFIPFKRSKAGKKFAFVRFIKVTNLDRLVENLCTIWIGRFHLYANQVRFERPQKPNFPTHKETTSVAHKNSFASVLKEGHVSPDPTLVLDESCIKEHDLNLSLMGKKNSVLLGDIGGMGRLRTKFFVLQSNFWFKTKMDVIINDKRKIIVQGNVFWIRVKELDAWVPNFEDDNNDDLSSDEEEPKANNIDETNSTRSKTGEDKSGENEPHSEDPFKIYDLLKKNNNNICNSGSEEPKYPPGFTPSFNDQEKIGDDNLQGISDSVNLSLIIYLVKENEKWDGETVIMGDFNEVRSERERFGSVFNQQGAMVFNNFISSTGLIDLPLDGYAFTWSHKSASKMSKLDRFLLSEGLMELFPHLSAICLDKNLSDHRLILLRETSIDYGPSPFRFFHSWFTMEGFDSFVENTWKSFNIGEANGLIRLKKKLQFLKIAIKAWTKEAKMKSNEKKLNIQQNLLELDKIIDQGRSNEESLCKRIMLINDLHEINSKNASELSQKVKIRWSIEGDENSKYFHGILNKRRPQLVIRGVLVDGDWISDPSKVKDEFFNHFKKQFSASSSSRICFRFMFFPTLAFF
ncbi:RNA-directed DNA polymerase, eukaryota [Tanacetum coccineum]